MSFVLQQVTFRYCPDSPASVFANFSASFDPAKLTGLTGKNGSGKTTLLGLMLGLLKPQSGQVFAFGSDVATIPLWKMSTKIGYLRQNPARQLFAPTVWQEMLLPFHLLGRETAAKRQHAEALLQQFHLQDRRDLEPFCLSTGEQKRLAFASLLMHEPDFLLLDEPGSGLDEQSLNLLSQCLQARRAEKKGSLIVSHDPAFLTAHCDRNVCLSGDGDAEGVYEI